MTDNVEVDKIERNYPKQWLIIHMKKQLQRGEQYSLYLPFSGSLAEDPNNGIYMETYVDHQTGEKR